ncbi:uncharacterized protein G2W53_034855 [Senna tora]|uniref:Uncharacterized protein n=1 Tax=Senna tora TaxID=362788 RepID=A0A834T111_9FABA|nr:uncharacterized protein G2W53_034855 [Senna tora]
MNEKSFTGELQRHPKVIIQLLDFHQFPLRSTKQRKCRFQQQIKLTVLKTAVYTDVTTHQSSNTKQKKENAEAEAEGSSTKSLNTRASLPEKAIGNERHVPIMDQAQTCGTHSLGF